MTRPPDPRRTAEGPRPTAGGGEPPSQTAKAHELVAMAHALCDEGRAREAEDMARWALSQAPHLAAGQTALARARFELGHVPEAIGLFEGIVRSNRNFFPVHRWFAEALVRIGDWPRASEVLVRAEALSPGDARIAQLVQQVMAASPARTPGAEAQASALAPNTQPPPRRRTYEAPAVTASLKSSSALVRAAPGTVIPARSTTALGGNTPTRGDRPRPPSKGYLRRARAWLARHNPLPVMWRLFAAYRRFVFLGIGVFAVTVFAVSWALRQPHIDVAREHADVSAGPLGPVVAGSYAELAGIRAKERRRQLRMKDEPTGRALLAEALLASEYGRPLDPDSETWADELAEKEGGLGGPEELLAARVLGRLYRGDRAAAGELARTRGLASSSSPLLRFVDGRRLERDGNLAAALARVGSDAERSNFLPLRLLRAELLLDQGDARSAMAIITSVFSLAPAHPGALRLMLEARAALADPLTSGEKADLAKVCPAAEKRIPTLATACHLYQGTILRREGKRGSAMRSALRASARVPDEPRLLAMVAQLLANLGASEEAADLIARTELLVDAQFPALAWAHAGLRLGRDRATRLPAGVPPGAEARLIAARSSFAGPPTVRRSLGAMGVTAALTKADGDLRWMADGSEARNRKAIFALTRRAQADAKGKPAGPVASYVVGMLARRTGQTPLAEAWLANALEGHGDACRSASLYLKALRDAGRDPARSIRLQRAIGRLGCANPPGTISLVDR